MLIAFLADIHANREAFEACLDDAAQRGVDRYVLLGDYVGYGPDPAWCLEQVRDLMAKGAVAVGGNHDAAVGDRNTRLNPIARAAMDWTRQQLGDGERRLLDSLPLEIDEDDRLYVHASAAAPRDWNYVLGPREAFHCFRATRQRLIFCGHTHIPALFNEAPTTMPSRHAPADGRAMPLLAQRRWVAVLGAVGQPRDRNPAACYALLEAEQSRLTYVRVPYDVDVTARKVVAAGLPHALAKRLLSGA
ncbi:MAG: metallophosphoesterase [Proteobacteria bacterium]|nr:metallophosphoesterase [Pseudomonadota bacterium]